MESEDPQRYAPNAPSPLGAADRMRYRNSFITLLRPNEQGTRVGIKDNIDLAGTITTAGCKRIAKQAQAAEQDATCLAELSGGGGIIVGKTNLHELAFGTTGVNNWSGTPVNPFDVNLIPGGSSCGNAVALAMGYCDVALGTDTGGSVRIPSACCGTAGLKTTYGRIATAGVRPLAPSLDIVGPMARDTSHLLIGMRLLEPHFGPVVGPADSLCRLQVGQLDVRVNRAVDRALAGTGLRITSCDVSEDDWERAIQAVGDIIAAEAALANMELRPFWPELQSATALEQGLAVLEDVDRVKSARRFQEIWRDRLTSVVSAAGILVSPTIETLTPSFRELQAKRIRLSRFTSPVSLAGLPAIVVPVPSDSAVPASLQLVGPPNSEPLLLATAAVIELSVASQIRSAGR